MHPETNHAEGNHMLDVEKIRGDFPILSRTIHGKPLVYLDNAATSQKPHSVIQALMDYYGNYNANVHRGVHTLSMEATDRYEEAREKIARFINADTPESIIWTRNTTESINLVAHSWANTNIEEGDEIVLSELEHHSNLVPWQKIAAEKGAILRFLPLATDGTLDLNEVDSIINPSTKLLAITHVSNSLGTILPVKNLAARARTVGATVLVDGAQSVPHQPVDVNDLDCDFLAFSGHKMMGPTGIGVLYAKENVLEHMEPFLRGGEMVLEVSYEDAKWNDLPMRFEAGTPNIADAIGLSAAVDYLTNLGMENIRDHEKKVVAYALDAFQEFQDITLYGPADVDKRGGILSFYSSEVHPHDLGTLLDQQGVAVRTGHHCTMPLMGTLGVPATTRASLYVYNTEEEVDVLVDSIKKALRYFANGDPPSR